MSKCFRLDVRDEKSNSGRVPSTGFRTNWERYGSFYSLPPVIIYKPGQVGLLAVLGKYYRSKTLNSKAHINLERHMNRNWGPCYIVSG